MSDDRAPTAPPDARIVHVITDLQTGGTELILARLLRHGSGEGQLVVSLGDRGPVGAMIEAAGIRVVALDLRGPRGLAAGLPRLVRLIRSSGAQIVQGWLAHGNLAATLAHRLAGGQRALIWNIRQSLTDLGLEKAATRAVIRVNALLSGRPAFILYNSEAGASQHEAIGYRPDKRQVVPNGFDLDRFSPSPRQREDMRRQLGIDDDEILIGLFGRFHPTKNHRGFLAAAAHILDQAPSARFLCAGGGVSLENPDFDRLVTDPRLRDRGLFLGARDDVPELVRALDIACNVSIGEGFSNAIGEAMACGVPCVATDSGDSRAVIADTGLVSASNEPASIAAVVLAMLNASDMRRQQLGQAARRRMEESFSLDSMVRRYEEIYEEAVRNAG